MRNRNMFKQIFQLVIAPFPPDWPLRSQNRSSLRKIPKYVQFESYTGIVLSLIIGPLLLWGSAANFQSYIVYDPRRKWGNQVMRSDNRNMISWFGKNSIFCFVETSKVHCWYFGNKILIFQKSKYNWHFCNHQFLVNYKCYCFFHHIRLWWWQKCHLPSGIHLLFVNCY